MKKMLIYIPICLIVCSMESASAQSVTFTKEDSADWTLPENQDIITENVAITRKHNQSIFNIAQEEGYSAPNGSPVDTEWAHGMTAEMLPDDYSNFVIMHGGDPHSLIGDTVSFHLITDDLYFDVIFNSYTGGNNGGGFSYTRTQYVLSIDETANLIKVYSLNQNYPNPFNPVTTISYDIPTESNVTLTIYDITGRMVKALINETQQAGMKQIMWNATDVSSGVYIYRIQAGDFTQTRKMILLK